jgi:hypothetical protein
VLTDGGGRELAYVAMSRAREATHIYTTADDTAVAVEDLTADWLQERRPRWAIDTGLPATGDAQRHEVLCQLTFASKGCCRSGVKGHVRSLETSKAEHLPELGELFFG